MLPQHLHQPAVLYIRHDQAIGDLAKTDAVQCQAELRLRIIGNESSGTRHELLSGGEIPWPATPGTGVDQSHRRQIEQRLDIRWPADTGDELGRADGEKGNLGRGASNEAAVAQETDANADVDLLLDDIADGVRQA